MSVPAIALYAGPPSSVCSPITSSSSHSSPDHDLNPNPSSAQRPIAGGLSCLFSSSPSPSVRHSISSGDELNSMWHDRSDDLSSSFSYSSYSNSFNSFKCRDSSPVSVFNGPVSCSGSSKSPPLMRVPRDWKKDRIFSGFVRNALGSCLDYNEPMSFGGGVDVEELTFDLDESLVELNCEEYARDFLLGAQSRHKIFHEELVVKAFYEAEKAHRGQI